MRSVTAEQFSQGATVRLMPAGTGNDATASGIRHLHGNVCEMTADASSLGEVVRFGASAWEFGKSISRNNATHVDSTANARDRKVPGVGFRVMLKAPTSWKRDER